MKKAKQLTRLCSKAGRWLGRNSSTILAVFGTAGVVGTSVMVARATIETQRKLDEATNEKRRELTATEAIVTAVPVYIPAAVIGGATIACILGSSVLDRRHQAALTSAYVLLNSSYSKYKAKVKDLYRDVDSEVRKAILEDELPEEIEVSDGKMLFYEEISHQQFERTKEEVLLAEYHLNRNFILRGYCLLNEFYEFLGLPKTDYGDVVGWDMDFGAEFYGYQWIDFTHDKMTLDDGLEICDIVMDFPPHPLDEIPEI